MPPTSIPKVIIDGSLAVIGNITPIGRTKLEQKLATAPGNQQIIAALILEADNRAGLLQGASWKAMARAWLLVKYVATCWAGAEQGVVLVAGDKERLFAEMGRRSEASLRSDIENVMTSRGMLALFAERQRAPSRQAWATGFTDPAAHKRTSFCYLIHGMRPTTSLKVDAVATKLRAAFLNRALRGNIGVKDPLSKTWQLLSAQMFLTNPEALRAELLSCSVITDARTKTYGDVSFGFVLSAPPPNICQVGSSDLAVSAFQHCARGDALAEEITSMARILQVDDFIIDLVDGHYPESIMTPVELVNAGTAEQHNEVLVIGSISGSAVKPTAIFVKVTRAGKLWKTFFDDDTQYGLAAMMTQCSRKLNIPIVDIPDDRGVPSKMDFATWKSVSAKMFH